MSADQQHSAGSLTASKLKRPVMQESHDAERFASKGFTVRDAAARYRVGPDKIRAWIRQGRLKAINTATSLIGRPRWVILPHQLAEFERSREAMPPPKPVMRRRKPAEFIDYYP
jgi:transposase